MVIAVEGNGFVHGGEEEDGDRPIRYLPLGHVYSSSARAPRPPAPKKPRVDDGRPPLKVYYRRRRKKPRVEEPPPSPATAPPAPWERDEEAGPSRRKGSLKHELLSLGSAPPALDGDGEEPARRRGRTRRGGGAEKTVCFSEPEKQRPGRPNASVGRRWVELDIQTADPNTFVGLVCKVFWPLDDDWYKGSIAGYNEATKKHSVKYDDGEAEDLSLADERIKFSIASEEMKSLNLKFGISNQDKKGHDELLALAVSFHDYQGLDPGDLVWAKITGHAMWPAVVVDESNVPANRALKPVRLDQSILVQFFGTHDFARIKLKQAVPFLNGLVSSLHLKCKQASFGRSLEEAKEFLRTQQLPDIMLHLRKSVQHGGSHVNSSEDRVDLCGNLSEDRAAQNGEDYAEMTQIELGNLRVSNLGRIVSDSDHFHNKKHIWPEGYTALRKFTSIIDPHSVTSYKMEVVRNSDTKARPLFRVISEDGVQIDGSTPNACWKEIYRRIKEQQSNAATELERNVWQRSGSYMFGFSNPQIRQLIQELPNARSCLKYFENGGDTILGYRAVHVNWKDLDFCNVCDMDEEYEDNLFLQCDKCRMMLEDDDKIHHMLLDEDEDPCIRLLSYCKKHRQPSAERPSLESYPVEPAQLVQTDRASSSGCARTGKSKIHGFGVFAKVAHKAGDMMIEYIGEIVRPPISDIRERRIYNSLVGAGTYMFRIDDERVIDATRAGSIAHLINHSCEPNCYSRAITVLGDEHIIIFAKRHIDPWEELTYDYRFFSSDQRLPCYCGFPKCRRIVNDVEAEEQAAKIRVKRSVLYQKKR
ncbi:Histone-lysine N-methyltransferase ATX2 [Dichanthelium oligosanthes]|uniref:Histone-lysine N-methyltransferase ATX2 n=1 Tax=Dichanthelium oligosanthes TaxID=888268 RepID=A0A1E5WEH5_9POAL|nr:Histone-lysine N-methyltransferase ATX2 [Dichanthelium oligosanthes]